MEVQAEIEYIREDGINIHSDIEPKGCQFESIDKSHKEFLHECLDEWLSKSNGTGIFYIKGVINDTNTN